MKPLKSLFVLLLLTMALPHQARTQDQNSNRTAKSEEKRSPAASSATSSQSASGLTEPLRDAVLGSPVIGIIGVHFFKEGDAVEEGDVIMELRKELEEIEVSRRKTILDSAKKALDRTTQLFKNTRSVSEEEMEQTQAQYDVALAEYNLAAENLRRRQIIAPFTGRITDFFTLEAGESVEVQTPLVRLVDTRQCYFVSNVEAGIAHGLKQDAPVTIEILKGGEAIAVPGTITFVSPVVDPASGLLKVRAVFDNARDTVRPGVDGVMIWNRD